MRVRFQTLAQALLVTTVLVILWGAWVRVSGSGAGCADHWPLCNGELVPRSPRLETLIELTHRVTSSLSGLLSIVVFVRARREFEPHSPARRAALAGLLLMLLEGAIGAMLVKLGLVAKDSSPARALVVGLHLVNTFLLLGAQLLTLLFARGLAAPRWRGRGGLAAVLGLALACVLLLGASGAITALGDTLFPAQSLAHGLAQDLAPQAHFLIRLRMWHPLLATLCGAGVVYLAQHLKALHAGRALSGWALALTLLYLAQLAAGAANLLLLAPAALQITHLFLADLVWLALVGLVAEVLATQPARAASELTGVSA